MVTITQDTAKLRERAGLQRSALSRITGVAYGKIRRVEVTGKPIEVTAPQAKKMAAALRVKIDDLAYTETAPKAAPKAPNGPQKAAAVASNPPIPTESLGPAADAFRAGAFSMLRNVMASLSDKERETVRELVDSALKTYLLGQQLSHR